MAPAAAMTTPPHFDVSTVLRSSEAVSVTLPCRGRVESLAFCKAQAAIVTSKTGHPEEAAVMVVVPSSTSSDVRITHFIPIDENFKHWLNQTPPSPSVSKFHESSRPHITLSLSNGGNKVELRISSTLTVLVQTFINDLRRLADVSRHPTPPFTVKHAWKDFYPVESPSFSDLDEDDILTPAESSTSMLTPTLSSMSIQTLQAPTANGEAGEDDEYPNPFLSSFSRSAFLRKRLFARQDKWSTSAPVKIRLITYNVNDKLPPPGTTELKPMVGDGEDDIIVVGLQEVDLRSQAMLYSQGSVRAEEWEGAVRRALKEKSAEYERVALTQYVGVVTIVLVKTSIRSAITRVETTERGIGLLGFGGNKAGVCVRMRVHDSTICFVNSHLAAFATALDRRRADYQTLLSTLTFQRPIGENILPAYEEFLPEERDKMLSVEDSHVLFWLGDLNYRVDVEDDILRAWVEEGKWKLILEKDQLAADIASGKSFVGFKEPPIDFPPSFKYIHGSSTLDTKRSPAYTDRVLYAHPTAGKAFSEALPISCEEYTSHEIFWSDHRPVSASYTVQARVADDQKRREAYVGVERELEKLEELYKPSLEFEGTSVEFGEVSLGKPEVRVVTLRNKGKVPASYSFKPPSADKPICKASIWPFPLAGTVQAGEEASLRISASVNEAHASKLTLGEEDLNDVLVLQVAEGKDTFLTIQATFRPTILTLPLNLLAQFLDPICSTAPAVRKAAANPPDDEYKETRTVSKPVKEIWRLLEYLMTTGQNIPDLWTSHVTRIDMLDIVERLDKGLDLPAKAEHTVASTLLLILTRLPRALGEQIALDYVKDRDDAFAVLEVLDQIETNILIGLMSVVRLCAGVEAPPTLGAPLEIASSVESQQSPSGTAGNAGREVTMEDIESPNGTVDKSAEEIPRASAGISAEEDDEPDDLVVHAGEPEQTPLPEIEPTNAADSPQPVSIATNEQPVSLVQAIETSDVVDEATVEALAYALFQNLTENSAGKKNYVRLMLEG